MDSMDFWRLCDELTIVQAALLIAGEDPAKSHTHIEEFHIEKRPDGYEAAKNAISRSHLSGDLPGKHFPQYEYDTNGKPSQEIENSIDVNRSTVDVEHLKKWLLSRGFSTGFFFPDPVKDIGYQDPANPRYAPKLDAAVNAWLAVSDPESIAGKSPKQSLMRWLREHAAEFALCDDDGKPNETGIEECAKVANWQEKGGAPKTPS
tara:strand:+ start:206 stop:820 length:615 start_codon:yes stop_codon:yes gene_type:complete